MANVFHGAKKTTLELCPVASATVIEVGDLVYHDAINNDVRNAGAQADNVGEEPNQAEFAQVFLGVASQASASLDTDDILVETSLDMDYRFIVPSATYRRGSLLGASEESGGTALEDQQLEAVTSEDVAIARVTDDNSAARTSVRCRFFKSHAAPSFPRRRADVNTETLAVDRVLTFDDVAWQYLDPGGAARNVDLPDEEESAGLGFFISNTADAAEALTIRLNGGGATILVLDQNQHGEVKSNGVIWVGYLGTET